MLGIYHKSAIGHDLRGGCSLDKTPSTEHSTGSDALMWKTISRPSMVCSRGLCAVLKHGRWGSHVRATDFLSKAPSMGMNRPGYKLSARSWANLKEIP